MSNLRDEAIKLVEKVPEEHLESVVGVLKNVKNIISTEPETKMSLKEFIETHKGGATCFNDVDVDELIRELRS